MAQTLTSPYGAKPSQLSKPVPGATQQDEVSALMAELETPKVAIPAQTEEPTQTLAQTPAQDEVSALMAEMETPSVQPQIAETETFDQRKERTGSTTQAIKETLGDLSARFQTSWGVTEKEKMGKLVELYGEGNVKKGRAENAFLIRRPGEKGFREFDKEGIDTALEFVGDLLDESRNVVEGATELGGRILGGAGGALVGAAEGGAIGTAVGAPTGPGALATGMAGAVTGGMMQAIAGQAAGGALGAVAGLQLGDWIAEKLVGIKQDPSRNKLGEAGVAAAIGGTVSSIFAGASKLMSQMKLVKEVKKASLTTQEVLKTAQEIEQTAANLAKNGIEMRQGKMMLSPGQIAGDLAPEAKILDRELSTEGGVRDFFNEQGKLVLAGWEKLAQGISNVTGKPAEDIFLATKAASKSIREVEGKTIGAFREMALKASDGKAMPMLEVAKNIPEFMERFGFTQKDGSIVAPSLKTMRELYPDASPAVLGKTVNLMQDLQKQLKAHNGNLPLVEVDRLYDGFRKTIDSFYGTTAGGDVARNLLNMKDALRDDWAAHIGMTLKDKMPNALEAYTSSMQKYSDIMSAQKTLKNIMKKDELSAAAFANQIFSPALGKDRVKQMKVLVEDADPDLWKQLVDQQLTFMQKGSVNAKTGRVDWLMLDKKVNELKKAELLPQMMTKEDQTRLEQFFSIAKRVDSEFNFKEKEAPAKGTIGMIRNMAILASGKVSALAQIAAGKDVFANTIGHIGKDASLIKWLDGAGLEIVMEGIPKQEQGKARTFLLKTLEYAKKYTPIVADVTMAPKGAEMRRERAIRATKEKE